MVRSRWFTWFVLVALASTLASCGGEAESREEPRPDVDTREALTALQDELRLVRVELVELREAVKAGGWPGGRVEIELQDAGPVDPYLATRAPEMAYIARKWEQKGFESNIEEQVSILRKRGHAAVAGIIPFLRDAEPDVRIAALHVLGELGVAAESAVPYIKERRKDPEPAVRLAARDALCAILEG